MHRLVPWSLAVLAVLAACGERPRVLTTVPLSAPNHAVLVTRIQRIHLRHVAFGSDQPALRAAVIAALEQRGYAVEEVNDDWMRIWRDDDPSRDDNETFLGPSIDDDVAYLFLLTDDNCTTTEHTRPVERQVGTIENAGGRTVATIHEQGTSTSTSTSCRPFFHCNWFINDVADDGARVDGRRVLSQGLLDHRGAYTAADAAICLGPLAPAN